MNTFLITGATGFIGTSLLTCLLNNKDLVSATVLPGEYSEHLPIAVNRITVEPLSKTSDYSAALQNINTVIHLAARVHIMHETSSDSLIEFRKVNLYGTERLARQAAQAGVKRFVFMSTIGVNGSLSGDINFSEVSKPYPHNSYSISKFEAEQILSRIASETGMEVVIIRAPLVYGPANPGNFLSLLRAISKCYPLPLAAINNKRSFIYVGNLADVLVTCAVHPKAAGQTYLVSDGEDVSTPELIRRTAAALGVPARLLPFPVSLIHLAAKLTGKSAAVNRLTGSLTVDSSKIRRELGWQPPFTMEEGLRATAEWFKRQC